MHATNKQRQVIVGLVLTLMREGALAVRGQREYGAIADSHLVLMAVAMGVYEQRPMTCAHLAVYVGMPRSTTQRKLDALEQAGMVERTGTMYVLSQAATDTPKIHRYITMAVRLIHKASADLSEMGIK